MQDKNIREIIKNAFELEKNGQYKSAIELLYQGLNIEPDNVELLAQISSLYLKLKNYEIAQEYALKALDKTSDSSFAKQTLINIYLATNSKEPFLSFVNSLNINSIEENLLNIVLNFHS